MKENNFDNIPIIPFVSYEASGLGNVVADIRAEVANVRVFQPKAFKGQWEKEPQQHAK